MPAERDAKVALASAKGDGTKKVTHKPAVVDLDPQGETLLASVQDPLMEALRYVRLLQKHCAKLVDTHLLAADVHLQRGTFSCPFILYSLSREARYVIA